MRHWLVLAAIYVLVAALMVPGPLGAQEEAPAGTTPPAAEQVPAEPAPPEPAPVETVPAEPAPAPPPAEPAPAPEPPAPAAPAPAAPAPAADEAPAATQAEPVAQTQKRRKRKKPAAVAAATENVTISDFQFTPAQITVQQGDTVTWTNEGPTSHSATSSDGSFDTGIFSAGGSRSATFDEAGTFAYICTPHPNMHGTVVVEASSSGGGSGDSGSGSGAGSTDTGSTGSGSTSSGTPSSGSGLPATGADALALAILGVFMLALGFAIQRRSDARESGAAGRIGW